MTTNGDTLPQPRPISIEDVQRMLGALTLEMEMLRRENAALREALMKKEQPA